MHLSLEFRKVYDYIVFLQPTSPLRNAFYIDDSIKYMFEKSADAIASVCEVEHPVQWSGVLRSDKNMDSFLKCTDIKTRSQDLTVNYRLNGAIFICKTDYFLNNGCMLLTNNTYAYEMPQTVSIDIDSRLDFDFAKFMANYNVIT